jgi:polyisoprenyl-teichoic acid--peptidoglycan teichoic acid transferase
MTEEEQAGTPVSRRRVLRWGGAVAATAALLGGGGWVATRALRSRYDVPNADLFGTPSPSASGSLPSTSPTVPPGTGIKGPLNMLLVGIDPRESIPTWQPHADAVLIMHVAAALDRAYLFSLPRDLRVDIPAFPKAHYGGGLTKLTHAMSYGARVPGTSIPSVAQGFQLLAKTVTSYTGITRFDAGAVLNFGGFSRLVDALGGVDMYVDQKVVSIHREPNGNHRKPGGGSHGYVGPQMTYLPGNRHFTGWQALDYGRQRYTTGGDYTRQRHQQQLIRAIVAKGLSLNAATDPVKIDAVLRALGKSLTFDGRGRRIIDYAYALHGVAPSAITLVSLPGGSVGTGGGYLGEQLNQPVARQFMAAVRADKVDAFLRTHPTLVKG